MPGQNFSRFFAAFVVISFESVSHAGIIIGALGAVMDVAVSLASSGQEIKRANPEIDFLSLYRSLINIGRDLLGTMANTLILAYAGSSLSLILLIFAQGDIPYLKIINLDLIASEIIRGIAGSLGIFVTIPLTALIASLLYTKRPKK
ncbi:YibE/F family protein [bacterium]|nr:YibE/F family protein [bacterium]